MIKPRNIQLNLENKLRKFELEMKDLTTFASGSDMEACSKAYKLYIRIVNAGVRYDISVRMRNQLKADTGYLKPTEIRTGNGGTRTVLMLNKTSFNGKS